MMDLWPDLISNSHLQGPEGIFSPSPRGEVPTHDLPGEDIHHQKEKHPSQPWDLEFGHIGLPMLIPSSGNSLAGLTPGGFESLPLKEQPLFLHDPIYPLMVYPEVVFMLEQSSHTPYSVSWVFTPKLHDFLDDFLIRKLSLPGSFAPWRRSRRDFSLSRTPVVITTPGYPQSSKYFSHWESSLSGEPFCQFKSPFF